MFLAVLTAFKGVKTDLTRIFFTEFFSGKGLDRTGIDADVAFPAGFIDRRPGLKGRIGQYRNEAYPGSETIGQEQAVFTNPAQSGEMGGQFVGNDSFQLLKIVRRRAWNGKGAESLVRKPSGNGIAQLV